MSDKYVNIYDLLEYARDGMPRHKPLKFFETTKDLSDYSYQSVPRKIYASEWANRGALKFVLRDLAKYREVKKGKKPPQVDAQRTGKDNATEPVEGGASLLQDGAQQVNKGGNVEMARKGESVPQDVAQQVGKGNGAEATKKKKMEETAGAGYG
jgi:hypothetical protein